MTFDALLANQKTHVNLGGSFQPNNTESLFPHPHFLLLLCSMLVI